MFEQQLCRKVNGQAGVATQLMISRWVVPRTRFHPYVRGWLCAGAKGSDNGDGTSSSGNHAHPSAAQLLGQCRELAMKVGQVVAVALDGDAAWSGLWNLHPTRILGHGLQCGSCT